MLLKISVIATLSTSHERSLTVKQKVNPSVSFVYAILLKMPLSRGDIELLIYDLLIKLDASHPITANKHCPAKQILEAVATGIRS